MKDESFGFASPRIGFSFLFFSIQHITQEMLYKLATGLSSERNGAVERSRDGR